jgi:hypothetical protein
MSNSNPPPDFTLWEDNLFNLNNHRQNSSRGLDDATIVDFYDNQMSMKYDAKGQLDILQNNLSPLTEEQCKQLLSFLQTPAEEGKNPTADAFSSCMHSVAKFSYWWNKKIKMCIKHLEDSLVNQLSEKDDVFVVSEVCKLLSDTFHQFHYSPGNLYMVTEPVASLVFILFGTQISTLFMDDLTIVRDKLLHNLAQIFTGIKPYHDVGDFGDKATQHSPTKIPHNWIFYEMVLVMCGSMIGLFFDQRFLKWASNTTGNTAFNMIRVSKTCLGNDGGVVFPPPTFTAPTVNEPHENLSLDTSRLSSKKRPPQQNKQKDLKENSTSRKKRTFKDSDEDKENDENLKK